MNNWRICWFSRIFLLGILIFKGLTTRRVCKSFGVKRDYEDGNHMPKHFGVELERNNNKNNTLPSASVGLFTNDVFHSFAN
jgi:hypothetical protein